MQGIVPRLTHPLSFRVLVRKGVLTNEEVAEEVKVVWRELEGKRGR